MYTQGRGGEVEGEGRRVESERRGEGEQITKMG
jgi:hypothetical protein